MFNESSGIVQVWVNLIRQEIYTVSQIPNLSNLREMIMFVLGEEYSVKG